MGLKNGAIAVLWLGTIAIAVLVCGEGGFWANLAALVFAAFFAGITLILLGTLYSPEVESNDD